MKIRNELDSDDEESIIKAKQRILDSIKPSDSRLGGELSTILQDWKYLSMCRLSNSIIRFFRTIMHRIYLMACVCSARSYKRRIQSKILFNSLISTAALAWNRDLKIILFREKNYFQRWYKLRIHFLSTKNHAGGYYEE